MSEKIGRAEKPTPEPKKRSSDKGLRRGFIKGYTEETFGTLEDVPENPELTPLSEREEDQQTDLFYQVFDLIAEKRRFMRDEKLDKKSAGKRQTVSVIRGAGGLKLFARRPRVDNPEMKAELMYTRENRIGEINAELKKFSEIPGFREAYERRLTMFYFHARAMRQRDEYETQRMEAEAQLDYLHKEAIDSEAGELTGSQIVEGDALEATLKKSQDDLADYDSYELGFNLKRLSQIREYVDSYNELGMAFTPSVRMLEEWGLRHLRRRQHIALVGHLGSGKTALAKHLAKLISLETTTDEKKLAAIEADPLQAYKDESVEIFSGSKEASIYDLVGKLKLRIKGQSSIEQALSELEKYEDEIKTYEQAHGVELDRADIAAHIAGKSEAIETFPEYGPLVRALREGKPCIIDEFNRIRPEVMARLNDIALAKVGDKVRIQENGEELFEIKPGFTLIFTGNLGEKYKNLEQVDAAFAGRIFPKEVDYPPVEETYDMILSSLLTKDRLRMPRNFPKDQYERLASLAVTAREIQDIFAGKVVGKSFAGLSAGKTVSGRATKLESGVLSTRDLMYRILGTWRRENFRRSIDEVAADEYISGQVFSAGDRKFLTEIFLRRGFFADWSFDKFKDHGLLDLSDQEISALRSEAVMSAFAGDDAYKNLYDQAKQSGSSLQRDVLIGVKNKQDEGV